MQSKLLTQQLTARRILLSVIQINVERIENKIIEFIIKYERSICEIFLQYKYLHHIIYFTDHLTSKRYFRCLPTESRMNTRKSILWCSVLICHSAPLCISGKASQTSRVYPIEFFTCLATVQDTELKSSFILQFVPSRYSESQKNNVDVCLILLHLNQGRL